MAVAEAQAAWDALHPGIKEKLVDLGVTPGRWGRISCVADCVVDARRFLAQIGFEDGVEGHAEKIMSLVNSALGPAKAIRRGRMLQDPLERALGL